MTQPFSAYVTNELLDSIQKFKEIHLSRRPELVSQFDKYGGLHPFILIEIIMGQLSKGETIDSLDDTIVFEQICNSLQMKFNDIELGFKFFLESIVCRMSEYLSDNELKIYTNLIKAKKINITTIAFQAIATQVYYVGDYYVYMTYRQPNQFLNSLGYEIRRLLTN